MAVVSFNRKNNYVLHLWHLSEKLLVNDEEKSKSNSYEQKTIKTNSHTNSINRENHKQL